MPELPEVQVMRGYFDEVALEKIVKKVTFHDHLNKIFKTSRGEIERALMGHSFTKTNRLGKYLFARIDTGQWLHLHFGMTGSLEVFRSEELPRFTRMVLHFEDGDKLAFKDSRKFGKIEIIDDPERFRKRNKLGQDLLKISAEEFHKAFAGRNVAIKTALLHQKHVAGIGNWIADEMLFECGIHPEVLCKNLNAESIEALRKSGIRIVKEAIAADTHYGDFPEHFFFNYRKAGARHPDFPNSPVERLKVGGRSSFIVPAHQQKPET